MPGDRVVTTARLELRPLAAGDVDALHAMMTTPAVRQYMCDGELIPRAAVASWVATSERDFATRGLGLWIARRSGDPALVGLTGFRDYYDPPVFELIYAVHPRWHRQGLAVEMARAMLERGFSAGLDPIRASTDAPNLASMRVMARLGMTKTGSTPASPWEQVHFAITRAQFLAPA
ncbi:MAG: GNAT family N-acetyltransferase [Nannocystaceae bacterium]